MQGTPAGFASEHWTVTEPKEREALSFDGATSGADAARTFAAETDLSAATLLVHQYYVASCETRELDRLEWGSADNGPDGSVDIDLTYEDVPRDGDCEDDGLGPVEATLVRIPDQVELVTAFGYQV